MKKLNLLLVAMMVVLTGCTTQAVAVSTSPIPSPSPIKSETPILIASSPPSQTVKPLNLNQVAYESDKAINSIKSIEEKTMSSMTTRLKKM